MNQNSRTTGTGPQVVKNTTQNQYGTESVHDDQAGMAEFERDARDIAGNSGAATGSGSGSNTIFKFGSGSNTTRPDNTERHQAAAAAAAEFADAERFVKSHTTPAQHSVEQRRTTAVESVDRETFVNFQEQHNYSTITPPRQSNSATLVECVTRKMFEFDVATRLAEWSIRSSTQLHQHNCSIATPAQRLHTLKRAASLISRQPSSTEDSVQSNSMRRLVSRVGPLVLLDVDARIAEMTVRSLDVDARIVEWRRQMAFEKYLVSQLEECVKRHAINMLRLHNLHVHVKPRVWRWCDRKEATLGAYREKYLVKYLVEYVRLPAVYSTKKYTAGSQHNEVSNVSMAWAYCHTLEG